MKEINVNDKAEKLLTEIFNLLKDKDNTTASCFGLSYIKDTLKLKEKFIAEDPDVYELIESLSEDKTYLYNNFIAIRTVGWAAPLNDNGEVDGFPSQHPKRRRVTLLSTIDVINKKVVGSTVSFEDDGELIHDYDTATGSLADAILSLVE